MQAYLHLQTETGLSRGHLISVSTLLAWKVALPGSWRVRVSIATQAFRIIVLAWLGLLACAPAQSQAPSTAAATPQSAAPKPQPAKKIPEPDATQPAPKTETPPLILEPPPQIPYEETGGSVPPPPILIAPPPAPPLRVSGTAQQRGLESASEVIKVLFGLVFIFGLAYLAGHPRIQNLERRLQVSQVVTAGLPFVFLGVIAHLPGVGILSESVLWEIRPLLALGLGWIGFTIGFRFDAKLNESLVPGSSTLSLVTASIPFVTIVGTCALLLVFIEHSPATAMFLRDAMILATAGAMTAYSAPQILEARGATHHVVDRVASTVQLEQLAGVVGLMLVAAYFRPTTLVNWLLPGTAWLFITLGMGTTIGGVIYGTLGKIRGGPDLVFLYWDPYALPPVWPAFSGFLLLLSASSSD